MPANTRAMRIPNKRPERTIDIAEALFSGGARSTANGRRTWIVTLEAPTMKERASNTIRLLVTANPIVRVVDTATRRRMSCRRRRRSPRGDIRSIPAAYPAWVRVGTLKELDQ